MSFTRLGLMSASLAVASVVSTSVFAQTLASPPPPAASRAQQEMATAIVGQLQSVDPATKTIVVRTAAGADESLRYDDATKVTGGQSGVAGLANSKGTDVTVKFRGAGADRIATEIAIKEKHS